MKVTVKYKNREVEVEIPDEKLEELIKGTEKTGYERIIGDFYIAGTGESLICNDTGDAVSGNLYQCGNYFSAVSGNLYQCGNYFSSEELASNIARAETLMRRIRRRAVEICKPIDWKKFNIPKWYIYFDYSSSEISASYAHSVRGLFNIVFDTKKHAEQIIEEFKDELIWYFTEYKERMDG